MNYIGMKFVIISLAVRRSFLKGKVLLIAIASFCVSACATGHGGLPVSHGITNFAQVDARVCRGAQPDRTGIEELRNLHVKTILNLRDTNEEWPDEGAIARANGINYVEVPLSGWDWPCRCKIDNAIRIMEMGKARVFVHCQYGADRPVTI